VIILGLIIFIAALLGIFTRPIGLLAAFWPANAILAALIIRYPQLGSFWGWSFAFLGYFTADVLTGNNVLITLALTIANFSFAITCIMLFRALPSTYLKLESPRAILCLLMVNCLAALISAIIAIAFAFPLAPSIFANSLWQGLWGWFTADLVNSMMILPVILTAPSFWHVLQEQRKKVVSIQNHQQQQAYFKQCLPLLVLLNSMAAAILIGGPGAFVFHVPALLWCALSYQLFTTVLLTMITSVWLIIAISFGVISLSPQPLATAYILDWSISIRIGVALMTLVPLMVATSNNARNTLLMQLEKAANYDYLTTALSRSAFYHEAQRVLEHSEYNKTSLTVFMLDLDHFKSVNDRYGHAAGDKVLKQFSHIAHSNLRQEDIFARMGGEEFVLIMQDTPLESAVAIAERIRQQLEQHSIMLDQHHHIHVTVSIGMAHFNVLHHHLIDVLLADADQALYAAKKAGRNQIKHHTMA
jgi:diguanylate cyclase (GGDEF)-like protein